MTFCFHLLPRIVLAALTLLLIDASPARAEEPPPQDAGSGELLLRGDSGRWLPAMVQSSKAHFAISGMIATVSLEQRFHNATESWAEAVYAFPLPSGAAVRHMEIRIGERRIVGEIREREAAREVYARARAEGRRAGLVEQQRPNLFSSSVANIPPGESIAVRLEYLQTVDYQSGRFSLRFPMTITPRYIPGVPLAEASSRQSLQVDPARGWAVATDQVPDAPLITPYLAPPAGSDARPLNRIELTARLDMGMPLAQVDAAYHQLALSRSKGVYDISLVTGSSEMDRDFVLQWRPVTGSEPQAALFAEDHGGERYALLMVVPPAVATAPAPLSRDVVLVMDVSGSMGGVSIRQARASLERALALLGPDDRFNIIAFESSHRALFPSPLPARPPQLERARNWVRSLEAGGGTEMMGALQRALPLAGEESGHPSRLRQVVFITDGAVGNEQALFDEIERRRGESRLFTVGIGSAPNSWFMRRAAAAGRGTFTHIGDTGEVAERMDALFQRLASPIAMDIRVDWPAGSGAESWPARVPDLYRGEPLLLASKLSPHAAGVVQVTGRTAGTTWERHLTLPSAAGEHAGVAALWARRKIAALLGARRAGEAEDGVRGPVLEVALAHRLLSPFTSFVAVEQEPARPRLAPMSARPVANTRPRGQSPQPFAYPQTATTGPARLWFGCLALLLALLVHVMRRPEADRDGPDGA